MATQTLYNIAALLRVCDKETLANIRQSFTPNDLREAAKLLDRDRFELIKTWVIEGNSKVAVSPSKLLEKYGGL